MHGVPSISTARRLGRLAANLWLLTPVLSIACVPAAELPWVMIHMAMTSICDVAITPIQDILSMGQEGRMNLPSTPSGNWGWRLEKGLLTEKIRHSLREITEISGRL